MTAQLSMSAFKQCSSGIDNPRPLHLPASTALLIIHSSLDGRQWPSAGIAFIPLANFTMHSSILSLWANVRWAWGDRPADNPVAKAKYVACISILAAAYIFPSAPLKPIRDLCTLLLLVLFASVQYDVFARLPPYAQDYVHSIIGAQIDTADKIAELIRRKSSPFIRGVPLYFKRVAEQAAIYVHHLRG